MTKKYPAKQIIITAVMLFCSLPLWGQVTQDSLIRVTDLYKLAQLDEVTLSPDGQWIVYSVKSIVELPAGSGLHDYQTQLFIVSANGITSARSLTAGGNASSPAWHPDGTRLTFVRDVEGVSQLFELSLNGGEALQLTHLSAGATNPKWSPNGKRLMFTSQLSHTEIRAQMNIDQVWSEERPGRKSNDIVAATVANPDGTIAEQRAWLAQQNNFSPRVITRLNLQAEHDLSTEISYSHLFVMEGDYHRAPVQITAGYFSVTDPEWCHGGEQIIFSTHKDYSQHPDRETGADLYVVEYDGTSMRQLVNVDGYQLSSPKVSPDDRQVAFIVQDLAEAGYFQREIAIFSLDGLTAPRILTADFDRSAGQIKWSADGKTIYFVAPSEGSFPLFKFNVPPAEIETTNTQNLNDIAGTDGTWAFETASNVKIETITEAGRGIRSYDIGQEHAAYVVTEINNPYELYGTNARFSVELQLTDHNQSWLSERKIQPLVASSIQNAGFEVDYWVMEPPEKTPDTKTPLMIQMHGGPAAMWGPGEASMWFEFQFMAAQGYAIAFCNQRGSGGYGRAFKYANYQDWGHGPAGDVLALADKMDRQPWVDSDKMVLTGGSYAGYLTAWIITQDHRFKAAVAQRGVYDLATFMGEGNAWRLIPNHFGGFPWQDGDANDSNENLVLPSSPTVRTILEENSPLTYVDQIKTPLLIMHADNDLRTGVIQSEMLYKSLKILGKPVEYVRYPNAGHNLSRTGNPDQRIDRMLRIHEFMTRFID